MYRQPARSRLCQTTSCRQSGSPPKPSPIVVIFTNYQYSAAPSARFCGGRWGDGDRVADAFVERGNVIPAKAGFDALGPPPAPPERPPQMPAFHLVQQASSGITMINIGTGPSNARNITDHVAVLRPHAWLMLGHCAGLRNTQKLGDYALADGYVRQDNVQ